jgi:hypothetical protein
MSAAPRSTPRWPGQGRPPSSTRPSAKVELTSGARCSTAGEEQRQVRSCPSVDPTSRRCRSAIVRPVGTVVIRCQASFMIGERAGSGMVAVSRGREATSGQQRANAQRNRHSPHGGGARHSTPCGLLLHLGLHPSRRANAASATSALRSRRIVCSVTL